MTCFMVFYHTGGPEGSLAINTFDANLNGFLSRFFDAMGTIVMSYFFAVTGFLLFNNLTFSSYKRKIHKRIFSLLVPYILWQIIIVIKLIIQGNYNFSLVPFLKQTFLFMAWPIDGALWYVYAVFIIAVLSPILLLFFKNKRIGFGALVIIFILLNARGTFTNPYIVKIITWGYIGNVLFYLPAFLTGAFYGKFHDEIKEEHSLIYIILILFAAFCIEGTWGQVMSSTLMLMLPILLLFQLPIVPKLINLNVYKLTFLIYAIHQPLIGDIKDPIYRFYTHFRIPVSLDNILIRLTILFTDIAIVALIRVILCKICPKLLKLLCGGRVDNKLRQSV